MNDEQAMLEAIERDEDWFAQVCDRDEAIDTYAIKQRVHIEINEQWLARRMRDADDPQLAGNIREKVRETITTVSSGSEKQHHSTLFRLSWVAASTVGIAAMLMVMFGDQTGPSTSSNVVNNKIETSYVDAFEQYQGDEWDQSLDALSDEFDSVASAKGTVNWDSDSSDGWYESDADGDGSNG